MTKSDLEKIIDSAINGNEFPFDCFFEETFQKMLPELCSFTKSKEDAQDIFLIAMHKFWERFVINRKELPLNSIGYIYVMCRNAWLRKKEPWNTVNINDISNKCSGLGTEEVGFNEEGIGKKMDDDLLKHRALLMALEQLSPKCKKLMESELDHQIRLKDLQDDLGYTNYQALVQAKYNCKKKLVQKVYEVLINLKNNNSLSK